MYVWTWHRMDRSMYAWGRSGVKCFIGYFPWREYGDAMRDSLAIVTDHL